MRSMIVVAAVLVSGAALAEEPGFLFDALRLPHYKIAWTALVKGVQPTPDWLMHFNDFAGEAGDMKPVTIEGKPFMLSFVCKPQDCRGHKFEVLFTGDGSRAYGALGGGDEPPAFFGGPNAAQQEALTKAIQPVAAADKVQPKSE
jgi:hypothetical protein